MAECCQVYYNNEILTMLVLEASSSKKDSRIKLRSYLEILRQESGNSWYQIIQFRVFGSRQCNLSSHPQSLHFILPTQGDPHPPFSQLIKPVHCVIQPISVLSHLHSLTPGKEQAKLFGFATLLRSSFPKSQISFFEIEKL